MGFGTATTMGDSCMSFAPNIRSSSPKRSSSKETTTWMHPRSKHWHLLDYVLVASTRQVERHAHPSDGAPVAHTEGALQHFISCFAEAAQLSGQEISLQKTDVLHQPTPQEETRFEIKGIKNNERSKTI
uniref:Uncharacterized protein n=1 Tax=Octopus bimaculoides TaxID=37653 RepID=A0A0L8GQT3_OCTBM